ncbi:MAG: helix-turn-helix domain-containing protein [Sciscionella sp.]
MLVTPPGHGTQEIWGSRMHIHRSAHLRFFTTLGNEVLRDSRLSFCARGILGHLLSLPDGQRGDIRTLTERTPEGRERVASALRELEHFGYLKRVLKRTPQGQIYTEVGVFDTPDGSSSQVTPKAGFPGSGELGASSDGDHPVNERDEKPTHPAPLTKDPESGREGDCDEETKTSAALLARIARDEPTLSLGRRDALHLASLVTEWRRRGASDLHVIGALTAGLPSAGVYHPARFLETRLRTKMPTARRVASAPLECDACRAPVVASGSCRPCREPGPVEGRAVGDFAQMRSRGAAMARAALRGLSIDAVMPAVA